MKYTKGEWTLEETTEGLEIWAGDSPIATIHTRNLMDGDALDNGLLISKAPAMYEALKEIAKAEGPFNHDPREHAENVIENMQSLATSALEDIQATI